jgi:hypothetical protein
MTFPPIAILYLDSILAEKAPYLFAHGHSENRNAALPSFNDSLYIPE